MSKNYYQELLYDSEPSPIDFNSFDASFHNEPEQLKRRIRAKNIKATTITDNGDHYVVIGSKGDIYNTNLSICNCLDFKKNHLPCKHMYKFALDHGLIDDLPKINPKKSKLFAEKIDSELERFRSYYDQGLISAEKYTKIVDAIKK